MGTSGKAIRHNPDSYISALLVSFSKINLKNILHIKKKKLN